MSINTNSFFSYSDFSFKKEKPDTEEKFYKNKINIYLFDKKIYQNRNLNGYCKILIPEFLEKGSFFIKIIGKVAENINDNFYNNIDYNQKINKYKNTKITAIYKKNSKNLKKKIYNGSVIKFTRHKNKIRPVKTNIHKIKDSINIISDNFFTKSNVIYEKEYKLFTINEELNQMTFLILPFTTYLSKDFYPSLNLKFPLKQKDCLDNINNDGDIKSDELGNISNKYYINLKYKLLVYFISDKASNELNNLNKLERLRSYESLTKSNNYFENSTYFRILKETNLRINTPFKYDFLIKINRFNISCFKCTKNYKINISLNKKILNDLDSVWCIHIIYDKTILKQFNFLEIIIVSSFKNKIKNYFNDNIIYYSSDILNKTKINKNANYEFIKQIDFNIIINKIPTFETFNQSNSYFLLFYLSKSYLKFEHLINNNKVEIFYQKFSNYVSKTPKQIKIYYKNLEKKINNIENGFLLPFNKIKLD